MLYLYFRTHRISFICLVDENDAAWPERVLEVAGVLPTEKSTSLDYRSLPPAPPRTNGVKMRCVSLTPLYNLET